MKFAPIFALAVSLAACSPEGFEISACSSEGRLAFRIHKIDGWLWDYQPRPNQVLVRETQLRNGSARPMWSARINGSEQSGNRRARKIVLYGQHLPEWQVETAAHPLSRGTEYYVSISDGGRSGPTNIIAGKQLPIC